MAVRPVASRPLPKGRIIPKSGAKLQPTFQLFDPRKRFGRRRLCNPPPRLEPRIRVIGPDPRIAALFPAPVARPQVALEAPSPAHDGLVSAVRLARRLQALKRAVDDIPNQARRLLRWQARRARQDVFPPRSTEPLRLGRPPGYRAEPEHDVDDILIECHSLALHARRADTS